MIVWWTPSIFATRSTLKKWLVPELITFSIVTISTKTQCISTDLIEIRSSAFLTAKKNKSWLSYFSLSATWEKNLALTRRKKMPHFRKSYITSDKACSIELTPQLVLYDHILSLYIHFWLKNLYYSRSQSHVSLMRWSICKEEGCKNYLSILRYNPYTDLIRGKK